MTYLILALNILVFGAQLIIGDAVLKTFALWPLGAGFAPWQIVSSAFLHGSVMHLGANMLGLWMFGRDVERVGGAGRFLLLYVVSVLCASAAQLAYNAATGSEVPTVGASGGLFGVLAAFAWLYPRRKLIFLLAPVPLPAPVFVLLYSLMELYLGITGTAQGIAHFAHLGGLAGSLVAIAGGWRRQR